MQDFFTDKVILLTGAAGTIGQELLRQLVSMKPAEIRIIDNNESEMFFLSSLYGDNPLIKCYLGDVRDGQKLVNITRGVDIVFHTAALKHVILSEYSPFDAVQTNIIGVKNLVQASLDNRVSHFIFTSSDKAVNPTNVMGTSKLMGERIITAANIVNNNGHRVFTSVRFGNVLASRGSVIPIFAGQILRGQAVTITDARMTRFVMTLRQAAQLVLEGAKLACGGEVFVTKMPVMRILDLARAMIDILSPLAGRNPEEVPITYIGAKPGEKFYEELMSQEEVYRTQELPNMFVILPALRSFYDKIEYSYPNMLPQEDDRRPYVSSSQKPMTMSEIKQFLQTNHMLDQFTTKFLNC